MLKTVTVQFLTENISAIRRPFGLPCDGYRHICIDKKEEKSSIYLCSKHIDSKTNKIPAAQEILTKPELKGTIAAFDPDDWQT